MLKTCVLNDTEASILIFVVQNRESYASIIAKKLNIKRPTVYAALESLIQRELIIKNKQNATTTYLSRGEI